MAYSRRSSQDGSMPVPGADPGVVSVYIPNSASETNIPVKVPWDGCRLAYACSSVVTAVDTVGAMEIDLELDTAGGTEIMTLSVAAGSAAGTEDEATFSSESTGRHLDKSNKIIVEVDGSTTGSGAANLFLYFEPDTK